MKTTTQHVLLFINSILLFIFIFHCIPQPAEIIITSEHYMKNYTSVFFEDFETTENWIGQARGQTWPPDRFLVLSHNKLIFEPLTSQNWLLPFIYQDTKHHLQKGMIRYYQKTGKGGIGMGWDHTTHMCFNQENNFEQPREYVWYGGDSPIGTPTEKCKEGYRVSTIESAAQISLKFFINNNLIYSAEKYSFGMDEHNFYEIEWDEEKGLANIKIITPKQVFLEGKEFKPGEAVFDSGNISYEGGTTGSFIGYGITAPMGEIGQTELGEIELYNISHSSYTSEERIPTKIKKPYCPYIIIILFISMICLFCHKCKDQGSLPP